MSQSNPFGALALEISIIAKVWTSILDRKDGTENPHPPNQGRSRGKSKRRHFPILDLGERRGTNFPSILSKIVWKVSTSLLIIIFQHIYRLKTLVCDPVTRVAWHSKNGCEGDYLEHGITRKSYKEFCDRVKRAINVISQESLDCVTVDFSYLAEIPTMMKDWNF